MFWVEWVPGKNFCKNSMFLVWLGRLFQALDAATGNARSPRVECRVDGIINDKLSAERRQRRALISMVRWKHSARYAGAEPWRQRWTTTHNRNWICSGTRSQWSSQNRGVMCSDFLAEKTNRAAAFRTDCNLSIRWPMVPASAEMQ